MIFFAYAGLVNDISGVTSWVRRFFILLKKRKITFRLHLQHLGTRVEDGTLYQEAVREEYDVTALPRQSTSRAAVRDILKQINISRPSVFLPHSLPALHFAARIAQKAGLPWIFTIHSDDPEYWALADGCGPDRKAGVWVAVSEAIAREAINRYPYADVRVIPYGVRIPKNSTTWDEGKFRIVYSGRMVERQKCISKVLDVFVAACQSSTNIEAVFIGDGAEKSLIEDRVAELGMQERIRFTGRLDTEAVHNELLSSQAILLMSDFEGLPLSLLEAMACGVVPIVRNIRSGIPEIIHQGKTGYLVDDNIQKAAKTIIDLASDRDQWQQISSSARELAVTRYDENKCFDQWISLINEMQQKSTVKYPIKVPLIPNLPPFDNRLNVFDQRTPLLIRKVQTRMHRYSRLFTSK